ncbi:GTPase HflX [Fluviispira multicolorata]|uniref:GTPase HflX n=1 Tax=Fluviispira multicolorata TaxID=2654512 RepID=A0A833N4B6_9BACT|nr:GTPase HflX [Fluviispira multicolorata]KAB8031851.1 GTPase HflX [Fluviispira multicolorata]
MSKNNIDIEKTLELEKARQLLESRVQGGMKSYLVSLELPDDDPVEIQESLVELGALVRTLGDECVGVTVQKKAKPVPATYIGLGKAEEIKNTCDSLKFDYVIFDQELSPTQVRNLENLIVKPILDRTGVILQIFRKNARSKEARTQVEIAHLEYIAPRLSNAWITWERQRGGGGSGGRLKGAGETQIEIDRRRMKDKIASLRKDLEKIQKERETQRKNRADEWNVVLVGYTNAGKTTLMNFLTESHLSAKDSLFETLDSSIRRIRGVNNMNILVTDTVGFIRNLPHGLVASFRSTLEETSKADLLLHIVDITHKSYKEHIKVTDEVLAQVGASDVPRIIVFNKIDKILGEPRLPKILARGYPRSICLSSYKEEDIKRFREMIVNFLAQNMVEEVFHVAYGDSKMLSLIYSHARVLESNWTQDEGIFKVRMSKSIYHRYFAPVKAEEEQEWQIKSN